MDPAFGCGHGEPEGIGDFLVREALDVPQHERRTEIEVERADAVGEERKLLVLLGLRVRATSSGRGRGPCLLDVRERARVEPLAPNALKRLVDGDAVEPGEGSRVASEPIEVSPRLDEGVLSCLVNVALVVEQPPEHCANAALEHAHELGERLDVAFPRLCEKPGTVLAHATTLASPRVRSRIDRGLLGPAMNGISKARASTRTRMHHTAVRLLTHPLNGSHAETARFMSDYAEGDLRGYRRFRLARHLARCEMCQAAYRAFLATLTSLAALGRREPEPKPELAEAVVERIRAEGEGA